MTSIQLANATIQRARDTVLAAKIAAECALSAYKTACNEEDKAKMECEEAERKAVEAKRVSKELGMITNLQADAAAGKQVSEEADEKVWKAMYATIDANQVVFDMAKIHQDKEAIEELLRVEINQANFYHAESQYALWMAVKVCDDLKADMVLECIEEVSVGCGF
jgi:hypothetical protein